MARGIADLPGKRHRVVGHRQTREPALAEGVEVVDRVARELAQPLLFRAIGVVVDTQAPRELGADVEVVAALADRRNRLAHEDHVMAGAGPRRVHVVALPERRRGQHNVGVARGRRDEVVVHDHELHA